MAFPSGGGHAKYWPKYEEEKSCNPILFTDSDTMDKKGHVHAFLKENNHTQGYLKILAFRSWGDML